MVVKSVKLNSLKQININRWLKYGQKLRKTFHVKQLLSSDTITASKPRPKMTYVYVIRLSLYKLGLHSAVIYYELSIDSLNRVMTTPATNHQTGLFCSTSI